MPNSHNSRKRSKDGKYRGWQELLPREAVDSIISSYKEGRTATQVAAEHELNTGTVLKIVRHAGLKVRCEWVRFTQEEREEIASRYLLGESGNAIARELGVNPIALYRTLHDMSITIRNTADAARRYKLSQHVFDRAEDSEEAAYFVGLLMADGSVKRRTEIAIRIQWGDRDILERFRRFLQTDAPIRRHLSRQSKPINGRIVETSDCCDLVVYSQNLADALARYGVTPNKSGREGIILLENNLHFWRGMIDGDGWVSASYRDPAIGLTGSLKIVEQFLAFSRQFVQHDNKPYRNHSIWSARIGYSAGFHLIRHLYEGCCVSLPRKQEKANWVLRNCARYKMRKGFKDWSGLTKHELLSRYVRLGTWVAVARSLNMPEGSIGHVLQAVGLRPSRPLRPHRKH